MGGLNVNMSSNVGIRKELNSGDVYASYLLPVIVRMIRFCIFLSGWGSGSSTMRPIL